MRAGKQDCIDLYLMFIKRMNRAFAERFKNGMHGSAMLKNIMKQARKASSEKPQASAQSRWINLVI